MTIKSHLAAAGAGSVVGGIIAGSIVAAVKNKQQQKKEKRLSAELGAIELEDAITLNEQYKAVIEIFANNIAQLDPKLANDFREEAARYCLPETDNKTGVKYVKIPSLREFLDYKRDPSGSVRYIFEHFDAYYKAKGSKTDYPVAVVRVLDNLHYLALMYIEDCAKCPGDENTKLLEEMGGSLDGLVGNVKENKILMKRDMELLDLFKSTKRKNILGKLTKREGKFVREAITRQKNLTLLDLCKQSLKEMSHTAGKIGEFLLRSCDRGASKETADFTLTKMAMQELAVKTTEKNDVIKGPVSEVVAKNIKRTEGFFINSVSKANKVDSFNERFNQGLLSPSRHTITDTTVTLPSFMIEKEEESNVTLPSFMIKTEEESKYIQRTKNSQFLKKINQILNGINVAMALEEDLRYKAQEYGRQGITATGEFELRRILIKSFYEDAIDNYKALLDDPYFKKLLDVHENLKFLQSQQVLHEKKSQIPLMKKRSSAAEWLKKPQVLQSQQVLHEKKSQTPLMKKSSSAAEGLKKPQVVNSIHIKNIESVKMSTEQVKKLDEKINEHVKDSDGLHPDYSFPSIPLNSRNFLFNIALACVLNPKIQLKILKNLDEEKTDQRKTIEILIGHFKKLKELKNQIHKFTIDGGSSLEKDPLLVEMMNNGYITEVFTRQQDAISFGHHVNIRSQYMYRLSFSNLTNIEKFRKLHQYLHKIQQKNKKNQNREAISRPKKALSSFIKTYEVSAVAGLYTQLDQAHKKLDKAQEEKLLAENTYKANVERLQETITKLTSKYNRSLKDSKEIEKNKQEALERARTKLAKFQNDLKESESNFKTAQEELKKVQNNLDALKEMVKRNIESQVERITKVSKKISRLKDIFLEIQTRQAKLKVKAENSPQMEDESDFQIAKSIGEGMGTFNELHQAASSLLQDVEDSLKLQQAEANALGTELGTQITDAIQDIHIQRQAIQKEVNRFDAFNLALEQLQEENAKQAEESRKKLQAAEDKNIELQTLVENLQKSIEDTKTQTKRKKEQTEKINKVVSFMNNIMDFAKGRYENKEKYAALHHFYLDTLRLTPREGDALEDALKEKLLMFLITCLQKRHFLTMFSDETHTGKQAIMLLNGTKDYHYLKELLFPGSEEENSQKITYQELADKLKLSTQEITQASQRLILKEDKLTIKSRF